MEQQFQLADLFSPAGDQPQAIKALTKGVNSGMHDQTLLGVTGSGKSITGSTLVLIQENGIEVCKEIGTIINEFFDTHKTIVQYVEDSEVINMKDVSKEKQLKAYSINPKTKIASWKPITQLTRHRSPQMLSRITLQCGRAATVTNDHNFYVLRKGQLCLTRTDKLHKGDYVPLPRFLPNPSRRLATIPIVDILSNAGARIFVAVPHIEMVWKRHAKQLRPLFTSAKIHHILKKSERISLEKYEEMVAVVPECARGARFGLKVRGYDVSKMLTVTPEILQLIGYYIAEGHGSHRFFMLSSGDQEVIDDFFSIAKKMKLHIRRRQKVYDYQVSSLLWTIFLKSICGKNSHTKRLPYFWTQLSHKQLAILLRAYFSGDGGVNGTVVSCSTVSEGLASDILYALLRFGIVARVRKKMVRIPHTTRRSRCWEITISGKENIDLFQREITFTIKYKKKALQKICKKYGNTNVDIIPIDGVWLSNMRKKLSLTQKEIADRINIERSYISMIEHGRRLPSRSIFVRLIVFLKKVAEKEDNVRAVKELEEMLALKHSFWSPIKSIATVKGERYVYDFAVEDNETFLAGFGGMFVHNTFTVANVIQNVQKPTLVIAHNKTLAAQLAQEFRAFFPKNAVEYFVSYYDYFQPEAYVSSSDTYIEKEVQINEEIDRLRHAATAALLTRRDVIIVASVSCIYGLGSPEFYKQSMITLTKGTVIDRDEFLKNLIDIRYDRSDVLVRGKFRAVGPTIEIVPAGREAIIRVMFSGSTISRIMEIDLLTGEKSDELDEVIIYPAKHFVVPEPVMEKSLGAIEAEMIERIKYFDKNNKHVESQRLSQRTRQDLEMMRELGYCQGIENYSWYLTERGKGQAPYTLVDYFPDDYLLVIDESHVTVPQIGGMYNGDRARKTNLVDHGFRLPSAIENRPLNFTEFEERMGQTIYVSATPGKYEVAKDETNGTVPVEQIIRPTGLLDPELVIKPIEGQVRDVMEEIKKVVAKKERVLITTLTKKQAEDLTEYLIENDIKTQYLHSDVDTLDRITILEDLRKGEFDVLVGVNLLREGLDLPEVSLVAILDADKEGFLRSEVSLIQTIGRAARHVDGRVILYADNMTGSLTRAISETERRHKIQAAHNKKHGITPQTIKKNIASIIDHELKPEVGTEFMDLESLEDMQGYIKQREKEMKAAAKNMDFEKAALIRDEIKALRKLQIK